MTDIPAVDLGRGVAMPMVGFGTWQLHGELAYEATRHALQAGYRHIDTATMYRNEEQVGRALADSGLDRARRVRHHQAAARQRRAGARATIAASLRALGTDYVDLWLVHWPPRGREPGAAVAGLPRGQGRGPGPRGRREQLQHRPDR